MAKAAAAKAKEKTNGDDLSAFEIVKALCEKAMGHGLVATEQEKKQVDAALEELESELE